MRRRSYLGIRVLERYRRRGSPFRARPPLVLRRAGGGTSVSYHPFVFHLHWAAFRLARAFGSRESLVLRTVRHILSTQGAAVPPWSRRFPAPTPSTSTGFAHARLSTEPSSPRSLGNPASHAPAGRRAMPRTLSTQGTGSFARARTSEGGSVAPATERHHVARVPAISPLAWQQRQLVTAPLWLPVGSPRSRRAAAADAFLATHGAAGPSWSETSPAGHHVIARTRSTLGTGPMPKSAPAPRDHVAPRSWPRAPAESTFFIRARTSPGGTSVPGTERRHVARAATLWPAIGSPRSRRAAGAGAVPTIPDRLTSHARMDVRVSRPSAHQDRARADDRGARRVALTVTRSSPDWGPSRREHRQSAGDARAPLYAQPVSRSFALPPAATVAPAAPSSAPAVELRPPPPRDVVQPAIDLGQLSEDVYQYIQRKVRIERERRGL